MRRTGAGGGMRGDRGWSKIEGHFFVPSILVMIVIEVVFSRCFLHCVVVDSEEAEMPDELSK